MLHHVNRTDELLISIPPITITISRPMRLQSHRNPPLSSDPTFSPSSARNRWASQSLQDLPSPPSALPFLRPLRRYPSLFLRFSSHLPATRLSPPPIKGAKSSQRIRPLPPSFSPVAYFSFIFSGFLGLSFFLFP
jgi:hypothetical protein